MSERQWVVDEESLGQRLDLVVAQRLCDSLSRTAVKRLIDEGAVTVDGEHARAGHKVHTGECICVRTDPTPLKDEAILPEEIPFDIVYEDEWLLVLNKPAGMLVHPVHGQNSGTLVNALLHHCDHLSTVNASDRPGIVHRLDRETSGIMLAVKDNAVHDDLAGQFKRHRIRKTYVAIVQGNVELDEGEITAPLVRHSVHFDKRAVARSDEEGRQARTVYKVLKRLGSRATVVLLKPRTGRTHQLRVHMKHLGHAILGDEKYGNPRLFSRLALHAVSIRFYHPRLSKFMEFSVPLPEEFVKAEQDWAKE